MDRTYRFRSAWIPTARECREYGFLAAVLAIVLIVGVVSVAGSVTPVWLVALALFPLPLLALIHLASHLAFLLQGMSAVAITVTYLTVDDKSVPFDRIQRAEESPYFPFLLTRKRLVVTYLDRDDRVRTLVFDSDMDAYCDTPGFYADLRSALKNRIDHRFEGRDPA